MLALYKILVPLTNFETCGQYKINILFCLCYTNSYKVLLCAFCSADVLTLHIHLPTRTLSHPFSAHINRLSGLILITCGFIAFLSGQNTHLKYQS